MNSRNYNLNTKIKIFSEVEIHNVAYINIIRDHIKTNPLKISHIFYQINIRLAVNCVYVCNKEFYYMKYVYLGMFADLHVIYGQDAIRKVGINQIMNNDRLCDDLQRECHFLTLMFELK